MVARIAALAAALALCGPAAALNPDIRLQDYNHAKWTARDGAPAEIRTMAQTPDGWLWLGTNNGLFRFDGVRFERYAAAAGGELKNRRIEELRAQPNGDLWIFYMIGGASVLRKTGALENLPLPELTGIAITLAIEPDGSAWIAANEGLYRYANGKLRVLGQQDGLPQQTTKSVILDQYGQLWTLNNRGLYRLDRATQKFVLHREQTNDGSLIQSPDGRLWLASEDKVEPLPDTVPVGRSPLPRDPFFNPAESRWGGQFDRHGNLWTRLCPQGLCLLAKAGGSDKALVPARDATDRVGPELQLSSHGTNAILEDIEGNIWVATQTGLDRFRENRLIPARVPQSKGLFTMAGDTEGGVWAVNQATRTAWKLSTNAEPVAEAGQTYMVAINDRDGALLLAGRTTIERRYKGKVTHIPLPRGPQSKAEPMDVLGLQDDGKVLWMASLQTGLMGYVDGEWRPRSAFTFSPKIILGAVGRMPGQLWHATGDKTLVFNDNGKLTVYDAKAIGFPTSINAVDDVLISGDQGLAVLQQGRLRKMNAAQPDVLRNISGMAITADGDRWLNGALGVVHVRHADWRVAMATPEAPLRYALIGALDGYPGQAMFENRLPSVYADKAGQLWFMASGGIVRLTPGQWRPNPIAPVAKILSVQTGGASYDAAPGLRLPAGSRQLSIQFTTPMLGKPEGVRFQYQLSGIDAGWHEPAAGRRSADYTNIGPGSYTFRVKATNEDGVPSAEEAVMEFEIAPTFMQTIWFKGLCVLAGAALLYLLYLYRLRVETGRVAERLHVRMAERERIARTLHDTFLQSVQAMLLRLDTVTAALPPDSEALKKMTPILDQVNDTISEGRDQVHELRSGRVDDVETAAHEASRQLEHEHPGVRTSVTATGASTRLRGAVAEEACEIVREAMRNAFRHGGGDKVDVQIRYERAQFVLQVADNGKGMDANAAGKQKHYGLVGMRERAARAGGKLDIDSGTEGVRVTLTVPARAGYAGRRRWFARADSRPN